MTLYEIVTLVTAVLCSGMIGSFVFLSYSLKKTEKLHHDLLYSKVYDAHTELRGARDDLKGRVEDFEEITKKASEANLSMGNMLTDIEARLSAVDERVTMLSGHATLNQGASKNPWEPLKKRKS